MSTKLTAPQQAVIDVLKNGGELWWYEGMRGPGHYTSITMPERDYKPVKGGTVNALRDRALIKRLPYKMGSFKVQYVLVEGKDEQA